MDGGCASKQNWEAVGFSEVHSTFCAYKRMPPTQLFVWCKWVASSVGGFWNILSAHEESLDQVPDKFITCSRRDKKHKTFKDLLQIQIVDGNVRNSFYTYRYIIYYSSFEWFLKDIICQTFFHYRKFMVSLGSKLQNPPLRLDKYFGSYDLNQREKCWLRSLIHHAFPFFTSKGK